MGVVILCEGDVEDATTAIAGDELVADARALFLDRREPDAARLAGPLVNRRDRYPTLLAA